jgi:hypothetical protein
MSDVRRDNNRIAFTQLRVPASRGRVFNSTVNHDQCFRAVGMVMTAVCLAWFQDAPANRHIVTITEGPVGKPGEIAPAEVLALGFGLREDLNVVGHGNGFCLQKVAKLCRSQIFIAAAAFTRLAPLGAASKARV